MSSSARGAARPKSRTRSAAPGNSRRTRSTIQGGFSFDFSGDADPAPEAESDVSADAMEETEPESTGDAGQSGFNFGN